jgi:hypothetical protein
MGVPHYEKWFKATIGHNTVLIDGKGQPIGSGESYGWIARFLHGESISYALGDASKAYDNQFKEPQKAGMQLFRRHLVFLRPSYIVVYDELEADHSAEWTWLIHSPYEISVDHESHIFSASSTQAISRVDQFASAELAVELSTEFDPKPVNFRGLKGPDGKILEYKDQWHIYSRSKQKSEKFRYLTVFQVKSMNDHAEFIDIKATDGSIKLSNWEIRAELDLSKEASFKILNQKEKKALVYNLPKIELQGKAYRPKAKGSTFLIELIENNEILKESIDEFPKGRD